MLLQLLYLNLKHNGLTGTLPGSWSNLTSVSKWQCDSMFAWSHCKHIFGVTWHLQHKCWSVWVSKPGAMVRLPAWMCIACKMLWHTMWKCKSSMQPCLYIGNCTTLVNMVFCPTNFVLVFSSYNKDWCCSWLPWTCPATVFLGHCQALGVVLLRQVVFQPQGQTWSHTISVVVLKSSLLQVGIQCHLSIIPGKVVATAVVNTVCWAKLSNGDVARGMELHQEWSKLLLKSACVHVLVVVLPSPNLTASTGMVVQIKMFACCLWSTPMWWCSPTSTCVAQPDATKSDCTWYWHVKCRSSDLLQQHCLLKVRC